MCALSQFCILLPDFSTIQAHNKNTIPYLPLNCKSLLPGNAKVLFFSGFIWGLGNDSAEIVGNQSKYYQTMIYIKSPFRKSVL